MPGRLSIYGCLPIPFAADDLAFPAFFGSITRFLALAASITMLVLSLTITDLPTSPQDVAFFVLLLLVCIITHILYIALFHVTTQGTILEHEQRTKPTLAIFHLLAIAYCLEVGVGVFGVVLLSLDPVQTSTMFILILIAVVGIFLDFIILGLVLLVSVLLTRGRKPRKLDGKSYSGFLFSAFKGLSILCCGLFGSLPGNAMDNEMVWSEISQVVHAFLKDTLMEFTVTDLLSALLLLRMDQMQKERKKIETIMPHSPPRIRYKAQSFTGSTPASATSEDDQAALKEFRDFGPYMLGVYGWMFLAYSTPLQFFRLFPSILYRRLFGDGTNVEYAIFHETIGVDHAKRQILFSSFTSYLGQAVPYTITVDHEKQAIVIAVRGTMSVSDIALDLMCEPATLTNAEKNWGVKNGSKHYVHGGMLRVATRIRNDIEKQQILHRLLRVQSKRPNTAAAQQEEVVSEEDRQSFLKAMHKSTTDMAMPENLMFNPEVFVNDKDLSEMNCAHYRLIVCGHSLGSCMASILALLLRDEFPRVRCLAYSCVSAIFSKELAEEANEYISSITLGKDIFGRMSWESMGQMRNDLLDVLRRCRVSKFRVIMSVFKGTRVRAEDYLFAEDAVPNTLERNRVLEILRRFQDEKRFQGSNDVEKLAIEKIPMFMPGKVMYLEKMQTELKETQFAWCCTRMVRKSTYRPMWITDRAQIQTIKITSRLILDHMPDYLMFVLNTCAPQQQQQQHQLQSVAEGDVSNPPPLEIKV